MKKESIALLLIFILLVVIFSGCADEDKDNEKDNDDNKNTLMSLEEIGIEMVTINSSSFSMGASIGNPDMTPPHNVSLNSFKIGKTEITQAQYEDITGGNPSYEKGEDNLPVEQIQWTGAIAFCNALSEAVGLDPCYDLNTMECDFSKNGYHLPTEAQWEYACRAGTETEFNLGDSYEGIDPAGWYSQNSRIDGRLQPHPVANKTSNNWGLFDMHGNVWEWCNDWYKAEYYKDCPEDNPRGPDSGLDKVLRGGSYADSKGKCMSSWRHHHHIHRENLNIGFRIACNVE